MRRFVRRQLENCRERGRVMLIYARICAGTRASESKGANKGMERYVE